MRKFISILFALVLVLSLVTSLPAVAEPGEVLLFPVSTEGRPDLEGTITADGGSVYFNIRAVGQADDGDNVNTSKYYSQTNFDNEYFTISANGKLLKYNMFMGNTTPYWGTSWGDATNPLPDGVTFSQTQEGDDFVYAVSMSYAVLGVSDGDTFSVQIKARDFNDDYVQSYSGYDGFDGLYSQYRGLWITDTGVFDVTVPVPVIEVEIDIKPGSDPNSINLKSKGVVPVAVLFTEAFDASTIDPSTVVFAGALPVRSTECDVDGDGDLDLLFHFKTQYLELDENSTKATLTSTTYDGQPIQGTDKVNIVPKKKGK